MPEFLRNPICKSHISLTQFFLEIYKTVCHCKLLLYSEIKASVSIKFVANQPEHLQNEHKYGRLIIFKITEQI